MTFVGGVYHDSLPGGRTAATVAIGVDGIEATIGDGTTFLVPFGELQLEVGGTGGRVVSCHTADRNTTIHTADETFLAALSASLHTPTSEAARDLLTRTRNTRWLGRGVWWTIGIAAIVAACLLPFLFGRLVERAVTSLPISLDEELGDVAWQELRGTLSLIETPVVRDAMQAILSRLEETLPEDGDAWDFRVMVVREDSINAFALPGGRMVLHSGLLDRAESAEEVAGVLAHEMGHVIQRHTIQRIAQALGIVAGVGLVFGDTGVLLAAAAQYLTMAAINKYSRDHEAESDAIAVEMMHRAGLDPDGPGRMLERMAAGGTGLPEVPHWLRTHPKHEDRIEAIRRQVEQLPPVSRRPLDVDWAAVRQSLR